MIVSASILFAFAGTPLDDPWTKDAEALVAVIEEEHPNPGHSTPIENLRHAASKINGGEGEPVAKVAELVASVGDGHTLLPMLSLPASSLPPGPTIRFLPIRLENFDDGLFIVGADRSYAHLVGAQLEFIGGVPAHELIQRTMSLLPHRTPRFAQEYAPEWLLSDIVLRHIGAATAEGRATLQTSKGRTEAQFRKAETEFDWLTSRTDGMTIDWIAAPEPLPLSQTGAALLDGATLYMRIEQVRAPADQTWDQSSREHANSSGQPEQSGWSSTFATASAATAHSCRH